METDREVLLWFHQRLVNQYNESELYDYMRRLRAIIKTTKSNKISRETKTCNNSLEELGTELKNLSKFERNLIKNEKSAQ